MAVLANSPSKPILSPTKTPQKKKEKNPKSPLSSPTIHPKSPSSQQPEPTDSEDKRSCHQCRQKGTGVRAICKNIKKNKPCTITFCQRCILNRYGEKVEDTLVSGDWKCPKCRDICNCSLCMKKKGYAPTGQLVLSAKKIGFMSVSEMLIAKGAKKLNSLDVAKDVDASLINPKATAAASPSKAGKENLFAGNINPNLQPKSVASDVDGKNTGKIKQKKKGKNDKSDSASDGNKGNEMKPKKKSFKKSRISEEVAKDGDASVIYPKAPDVASPSKAEKENLFAGKIELNLQPKSVTSDVDGKNIEKGKQKKEGKNDKSDSASDGNKGNEMKPKKKKSSKKSRISEEVAKDGDASEINSKAPDAASPEKENSFAGKIDLNLQPKSVASDVDGKNAGKGKQKKEGKNDNTESASDGSKENEMKPKKKSSKKSRISEEVPHAVLNEEAKADTRADATLDVDSSKTSQLIKGDAPNAIKKKRKISKTDGHFSEKEVKKNKKDNKPIKKEEKGSEKDGNLPLDNADSQMKISEKISMICAKEKKMLQKNSLESSGQKEVYVSVNEDNDQTKLAFKPSLKFSKLKNNAVWISHMVSEADIPLSQRTDLTNVGGVDFPVDDVGHALQFLEFCMAFGPVFDLKKGQPESVLRELMRGSSRRRGQYSSIVQFHIQLLSFLQKDSGEESHFSSSPNDDDSWLQALGECVSNSKRAFKDLSSNCFVRGGDEYYKLEPSKRLMLLNFLCDETLNTVHMRSWIEEQNSKIVEKEKMAREKLYAAKRKEKLVKQQMQDEIAKATVLNGGPLSISEHDDLVSKMKTEEVNAHAEMLQAMELVPNEKQKSDALRTEAIHVEGSGHIFWRLNSNSDAANILVQDVQNLNSDFPEEKWYAYDAEQINAVEKYISLRRKRLSTPRVPNALAFKTTEANIKPESSTDLPSQNQIIMDGEKC